MEKEFDIVLGKIYLLYYKAKISLGEAHLMQTPKGYLEKFDIDVPFKCDLDILDYLVRRRFKNIKNARFRNKKILEFL